MARLLSTARVASASVTGSGSAHVALVRVVAPANQKLVVQFTIQGEATSTTAPTVRCTVRRGSSTTGATTSAITLTKASGIDAETLQATAFGFSAQPTTQDETNGTIIDQFTFHPQGGAVSASYIVNGGENLTLWAITGTTVTVNVAAKIEE